MVGGVEGKLQRSLSLYRSLLALIQVRRSEEEVIHFVVDSIYTHFPDYRVLLSRVDPEGNAEVLYSRESAERVSMTGKRFAFAAIPTVLESVLEGRAVVVKDIRLEAAVAGNTADILAFGGSLAHLHVPFKDFDGKRLMLSLTNPQPVEWELDTVYLLREVSELVALMLREATVQAKLVRSESIFRQFADNVQVVFWMSDPSKQEMVYVSRSYDLIWGRSAQELYDNPLSFLDAIHPEDRDRVRNGIMRQGEGGYLEVYRVVHPDGKIRWVKDRAFPVRDASGAVMRIAGIAEDITALREAEDRLAATQAQVITNAKFAALGEMASGVAHEINNPLAVIHGLAVQLQELFRNGGPGAAAATPMVQDSLDSIEKMANRIAGIVKGLRTFSRQTAGDPMSPADLNTIVQETMAMCEAKLRAADIELRVSLPMSREWIRCRSSEISQVLLNLVSNAYDAVITARVRSILVFVEARDGRVRFGVEDSGGGIEPTLRDRIFQPFFTTKEVGRGTGLGLSISKGIVEAHGGRLFLDTTAQKTRFVVELPSK